jgi:hypothetical protein
MLFWATVIGVAALIRLAACGAEIETEGEVSLNINLVITPSV